MAIRMPAKKKSKQFERNLYNKLNRVAAIKVTEDYIDNKTKLFIFSKDLEHG